MFSITNMTEEGVLLSDGSFDENLNCTGSASPLSFKTGRASVRGRLYDNDANIAVSVTTPTTATRKDLIVLRVDYSGQTVREAKLTGVEGGGDPSLTQIDGTTWEIPLWRITITTGGAITLTDLREYCHFRTKVSTAMLDDGVLAASTTGRAKMADGFFAADATSRAKFASGFLTTDLLADGALTADATGRAKMADEFITAAKLSEDIDASDIGFSAALLCGRDPNRDFYRTDGSPASEDDEFDDGPDPGAQWSVSGSSSSANEHTTWKSHYYVRFAGAGEYRKLLEDFTPGASAYTVATLFRWGIRNSNSYCQLGVTSGDEQDGILLKFYYEPSASGKFRLLMLNKTAGNYATEATTDLFPTTTLCLLIKRDGNAYTCGFNFDDYSYVGAGSCTKVMVAGKIGLFLYFGDANIMGSGEVGVDWVRRDWSTI